MRKLCLFIGNLNGGGAEKSAIHLANTIGKTGIRVQLVLMERQGVYFDLLSEHVEIIDLGAGISYRSLLPFMRYLRRERPDSILSFMAPANAIAIVANRLTGKKSRIVVSEHSIYRQDRLSNNFCIDYLIKMLLAKWLYLHAHAIVAVSKGAAKHLERYAGYAAGRVTAIYNPVITSELPARAKQAVSHQWLNGDHTIILSVGRLHPQKNMSLLIQAFAKARKTHKAKLLIIGEGPQRNELKQLVRDLELENDVDMPGFQPNPYAYMARADMFVLSSDWEGLGNVLVEALSCGIPVIATDCESGPAEILDNGQYGLLVPVGNAVKLAEAITDCLARHEMYKAKAMQFHSDAMSLFTPEYAAGKYLNLLQE